jgi:hypothetical protein
MSLKIFELFKIINPPIVPPLIKGEVRGFQFVFILSARKNLYKNL